MNEHLPAAAIMMVLGLAGCVIPVLPGPPLVWLGAMYYAWRNDWTQIGWPMLLLLFILAVIGSTADLWMGYLGAKKGGASIWASLASLAGGLIGLIVFSIPGAIIGSLGAIALVEYYRHKDWNKVLRAGGGYMVGYLLAMVVELAICLVMIGLFAVAVYVK